MVILYLMVVAVIVVIAIVTKIINKRNTAMFDRLEAAIKNEIQEENMNDEQSE